MEEIPTSNVKPQEFPVCNYHRDALEVYLQQAQNTSKASKAIPSATTFVGGGGGFLATFFWLGTGPYGWAIGTVLGMFVGVTTGVIGDKVRRSKALPDNPQTQSWQQSGLSDRQVGRVKELLRQYIDSDPFLKTFCCPLNPEQIMLCPTIVVGRPYRYDASSLETNKGKNGMIAMGDSDPVESGQCMPDLLITCVIQTRLTALIGQKLLTNAYEFETTKLLSRCQSDLRDNLKDLRAAYEKELEATRDYQLGQSKTLGLPKVYNEAVQLLYDCRQWEYEVLMESTVTMEKGRVRCQTLKGRLAQLDTSIAVCKEVTEDCLGAEDAMTMVTGVQEDIQTLLSFDNGLQRALSSHSLKYKWLTSIATQNLAEVPKANTLFPHDESARNAYLALVKILGELRSLYLEYKLREITQEEMIERRLQIGKRYSTVKALNCQYPDYLKVNLAILQYMSVSKQQPAEGKTLEQLSDIDAELLQDANWFEEVSASPVQGNPKAAAEYVAESIKGKNCHFDRDYLPVACTSHDVALCELEKQPVKLAIRKGFECGQKLSDALQTFVHDDKAQLAVLKTFLSQTGMTAFLMAASPDSLAAKTQDLEYTVERNPDNTLNVTIAGRILFPDQKDPQVIRAQQWVSVTFSLEKSFGWQIKGATEERGEWEWVTHIPQQKPEANEVTEGDFDELLQQKSVYIQRTQMQNAENPIKTIYAQPDDFGTAATLITTLCNGTEVKGKDQVTAVSEIGNRSEEWLGKMISQQTDLKIVKVSLNDQKCVITRQENNLYVTKIASGEVEFDGGKKSYFPYCEKISIADKHRELDPLYLCDKPVQRKIF